MKTIPGIDALSELFWEGAFEVDGFADELDWFLEVEGLMLSWGFSMQNVIELK